MRISNVSHGFSEFHKNLDPSEVLKFLPRPYASIRADYEYFADHLDYLKERYPDRYVVILSQKVVASAIELDDLNRVLGKRGLRAKAPIVMFVEKTPRNLAL